MPTLRQLLVGERYYAARRQCERSLDWYLVLHCAYLASVLLIALRADAKIVAGTEVQLLPIVLLNLGSTVWIVRRIRQEEDTDNKALIVLGFVAFLWNLLWVLLAFAPGPFAARCTPLYLFMCAGGCAAFIHCVEKADTRRQGAKLVALHCCSTFMVLLQLSLIIAKLDGVGLPWVIILIPSWILNLIVCCLGCFMTCHLGEVSTAHYGHAAAIFVTGWTGIPGFMCMQVLLASGVRSALHVAMPILLLGLVPLLCKLGFVIGRWHARTRAFASGVQRRARQRSSAKIAREARRLSGDTPGGATPATPQSKRGSAALRMLAGGACAMTPTATPAPTTPRSASDVIVSISSAPTEATPGQQNEDGGGDPSDVDSGSDSGGDSGSDSGGDSELFKSARAEYAFGLTVDMCRRSHTAANLLHQLENLLELVQESDFLVCAHNRALLQNMARDKQRSVRERDTVWNDAVRITYSKLLRQFTLLAQLRRGMHNASDFVNVAILRKPPTAAEQAGALAAEAAEAEAEAERAGAVVGKTGAEPPVSRGGGDSLDALMDRYPTVDRRGRTPVFDRHGFFAFWAQPPRGRGHEGRGHEWVSRRPVLSTGGVLTNGEPPAAAPMPSVATQHAALRVATLMSIHDSAPTEPLELGPERAYSTDSGSEDRDSDTAEGRSLSCSPPPALPAGTRTSTPPPPAGASRQEGRGPARRVRFNLAVAGAAAGAARGGDEGMMFPMDPEMDARPLAQTAATVGAEPGAGDAGDAGDAGETGDARDEPGATQAAGSEPEPESQPGAEAGGLHEPELQPEPNVKAEPGAVLAVRPEPEAETKAETGAEAGCGAKSGVKAEAEAECEAAASTEPLPLPLPPPPPPPPPPPRDAEHGHCVAPGVQAKAEAGAGLESGSGVELQPIAEPEAGAEAELDETELDVFADEDSGADAAGVGAGIDSQAAITSTDRNLMLALRSPEAEV